MVGAERTLPSAMASIPRSRVMTAFSGVYAYTSRNLLHVRGLLEGGRRDSRAVCLLWGLCPSGMSVGSNRAYSWPS